MIWAQILELICIILRFMHIFLWLRSVLALSSFDCRFVCVELSFGRKARNWGQLSQEELQSKPNRLQSESKAKTRELKKSTKHSIQEATEPQQPEATTGSSWCTPQPTVVGAWSYCLGRTTVRPSCSRAVSLFFAAVRFPARFSDLNRYFVLKRGMHLAYLGCRIYSLDSLYLTPKLHWRRRK